MNTIIKVEVSLHTVVRAHLDYAVQFWCPHYTFGYLLTVSLRLTRGCLAGPKAKQGRDEEEDEDAKT